MGGSRSFARVLLCSIPEYLHILPIVGMNSCTSFPPSVKRMSSVSDEQSHRLLSNTHVE